MTGAEHYLEAERLLCRVANLFPDDPAAVQGIALAQIHATLAAAAPALFAAGPASELERQGAAELAEHDQAVRAAS